MPTCKICQREYLKTKIWRLDSLCPSCSANERKKKKKRLLVEYKGGRCIKCGYNRCEVAMVFHHRNPKEKDFTISGSHCRSLDYLKKEVDKCDLLCCRCHAELHQKLRDEEWQDYSI